MSRFSYKAFDTTGEMRSGSLEANSKDDALNLLNQKQLTLVNLKQERELKKEKHKNIRRVKPKSVIIFTRQLMALIRAGIPLVESIELLIGQSSDENMQGILKSLSGQTREGNSFSDSLRQFPHIFSELYINSIQVGEASGTLEQVLQSLVSQLENDMKLAKDLRKALSYPSFVIAALIMAFAVFITYVIPNFAPVFEKSGTELPLPTRMILLMSDLFNSYGIVILLVLVLTGLAYYGYYRSEKGKYMTHYYLLKLPLIGNLLKKVSSQRFSRTIAILIGQGIPLVQAMNTAIKTESNRVFKKNIEKIQEKVESGQSIAAAMGTTNLFPKMMIHMVSVGELTGTLEQMMDNVAEFTHSEISSTVENLTSLIEPVITIVLAVMVLFLALSIFLPMWNMLGIQ